MFSSKKRRICRGDVEVLTNKTMNTTEHSEETADKNAEASTSDIEPSEETRGKQKTDQESRVLDKKKNSAYAEEESINAESTNSQKSPTIETGIDLKVELNVTKNINKKNVCMEKSHVCRQSVNSPDLKFYQGHPEDAEEECVALTNENLIIYSDGNIMERPHVNITGFTLFDEQGHLCPLDTGLVEKDRRIYMSGYLQPISSDCDEINEVPIPVKDIGPIIEWFIKGFQCGNKTLITVSTEFAEYNLRNPSEQYKPLMDVMYEKIWINKVVMEYLLPNHYLQPTYEELLKHIMRHSIPELNNKQITEELLHKHANFVCDEMATLKTDEGDPLITVPCMRDLIKLTGINFGKSPTHTKIDYKKVDKKGWTKATTTPLVRKTFESFFPNQLDKTDYEFVLRSKRCGVCEGCQMPDCGECSSCSAMPKFGGHSRTQKACVLRFCLNVTIKRPEELDTDDDTDQQIAKKNQHAVVDRVPFDMTNYYRKIKWIGEPIKADANKVYYEKVEIDDLELCIGDFVMLQTCLPYVPSIIAKIVYMWKDVTNNIQGYFHGEEFFRSSDTVLGEVGDPREVFLCNRCCHGAPLSAILRKASVEKKDIPADWFNLGGKEVEETSGDDDGKTYFYNKYYERFTARFEDLPDNPTCPNELRKHRFCPSCERKMGKEDKIIPKVIDEVTESSLIMAENWVEWSAVRWRGYDYKKGCGVFLKPNTFKLKSLNDIKPVQKPKLNEVDEDIYTEYYRKSDTNLPGSNVDTGQPFCVGYIAAVVATDHGLLVRPQNIFLRVNVMFRPENTNNKNPHREDLNVVYWTDEIVEIPFSTVVGPCHLIYEKNVPEHDSPQDWLDKDPSRFYFKSAYNHIKGRVGNVPSHATVVGRTANAKGKGKGKGKSSKPVARSDGAEADVRPLRTLDIFAGCGGLSEGLRQVGVAECRWAIENLDAAAHAYSLNNKNCAVFTEDCNVLLREVMDGATHSGELRLPMRGEVDLLCGGPPCQGFSGMNRFNSRDYSNFKNSLIASFLSYCDYYRPRFLILENVRNFVEFKRGMVLKLTMRALLAMGYQCTFGVLQAGQYGVPQTRRRLIVLGAAPGYVLPLYPEPTHVFSRRACFSTVTIDGKRFTNNLRCEYSAPRRTCTVRDAIGDLPEISSGASRVEIEYDSTPESHFQQAARGHEDTDKLRDHICKKMAPLVQARISRIPTANGSDWRDLPNICVELADGTKSKVLQYRYDDKRNGRSRSGALRGVCACASAKPCLPGDKQENTLIPWCLPHTGNRHNHWAGLYGRISWEGYFSTTVTDPEPMCKQGRVLHPDQPRVLSVRECARSQGFPDHYVFMGSLQDKYRQVGNAVPPPLAAALGREIKKAILAKTSV